MKFIDYFSNLAMPLMIIIIVLYGVVERKKVFDIFLDGAKDGIKVVFNIFPTLVGLFVAIGALRSSGIINLITNFLKPLMRLLFPKLDKNSKIYQKISMNVVANILGLGNAATPLRN